MAYKDEEETGNRPLIRAEAQRDAPCYIVWKHRSLDKILWLLGAVDEVEDFYWIALDKDFKLQYCSCVGGYDIIEPDPSQRFFDPYLPGGSLHEDGLAIEAEIREELSESIKKTAAHYYENVKSRKAKWRKVPNWERVERYYTEMMEDPFKSKGILHFQMWPKEKSRD